MSDKLTKRQKGFVKDYIISENGTDAAEKNYNTKDRYSASSIAVDNLKKPHIIEAIQSIAESIPDSLIVEKHLALLNKKEKVTKNNMTTGEIDVIDTGEIDVGAVSKGLDMIYKIKGTYAPDKNINLNINQEQSPDQLAKAQLFNEWFKKQQQI